MVVPSSTARASRPYLRHARVILGVPVSALLGSGGALRYGLRFGSQHVLSSTRIARWQLGRTPISWAQLTSATDINRSVTAATSVDPDRQLYVPNVHDSMVNGTVRRLLVPMVQVRIIDEACAVAQRAVERVKTAPSARAIHMLRLTASKLQPFKGTRGVAELTQAVAEVA